LKIKKLIKSADADRLKGVTALDDLEKICSLHYKYVKSYALSLCLNETVAEDITQETFYNAIKKIDTFKNDCKIETWLCRIAHNIFVNTKRRKPTENIDSILNLTSDCNIEENIIKNDNIKIILRYTTELPSPYKEVFYMKTLGDLPYNVIADVFGKTESWARVTYHRAKQQISERMTDNE
jgi:RNA polymerase sigma-70 factor (ECF subfamily)